MPFRRTEDEKQADVEAKAAAKAAEENERQRAAFWASPRGQARAARQSGTGLFQTTLALSQTQRTFTGIYSGGQQAGWDYKTRNVDPTDVLGSIEAEGWKLEHVGYVFRQTGSVSRDKLLSSGQTAAVMGEIVGIYLFRADESWNPPAESG